VFRFSSRDARVILVPIDPVKFLLVVTNTLGNFPFGDRSFLCESDAQPMLDEKKTAPKVPFSLDQKRVQLRR
jgi:hypothetical protein